MMVVNYQFFTLIRRGTVAVANRVVTIAYEMKIALRETRTYLTGRQH